jgi:hypothetical protein
MLINIFFCGICLFSYWRSLIAETSGFSNQYKRYEFKIMHIVRYKTV